MPYVKRDDLAQMFRAGLSMSNWMYNLRQQEYFKGYSADMKKMVETWDHALYRVRYPKKESK